MALPDAPHEPHVVAVLDSDPDTTEMLKTILEIEGFSVATGDLAQFRLGKDDVLAFLERARPDVIVYDLGIPYEANWRFLESLREHAVFARCGLVITTANKRAVESITQLEALEILGKPYDLETLVGAVRTATRSQPARVHGDIGSDRRHHAHDRRTGHERRRHNNNPRS